MPGKYFEELAVGDRFHSPARTITETDIILFAGLSGDYSPPHTNEEWCKNSLFKRRIAHGLLVASIASGLLVRVGVFEETGLAHMGTQVKFTAPVFPGDTIHVEFEITEKKAINSLKGRVSIHLETINQEGKMVETEEMNILLARKPTP